MTRLRTNIFANYAGQGWLALMGIAFVPFYLQMLGPESFGLVGFMLSLQAASQLLDMGIGGAVNRSLARGIDQPSAEAGSRDLVRTFETMVWPMTLAVGALIAISAPAIAADWLNPEEIGIERTRNALLLMALAVAALWPSTFYTGVLSGLERQTMLNAANAFFATLRYAGVLAAMHFLGANIEVFIGWYAVVGAAQSVTLAVAAWRAMPDGARPKAHWSSLRGTKRFAGGMFAITALSLLLSQIDRVAISALRPLSEMGYYSLAISVSAGLGRMVLPMFNALYPRFSRLVASSDQKGITGLYHISSQWLALVVASTTAVLVVFADDVLLLWTGDTVTSGIVGTPMSILVLGSAFNGLLVIPYALQLAHGTTRIPIIANLVALALAIPLGYLAVDRHGLSGAASIWLAINLANFAIAAPIVHRRWLPGESRAWYIRDLLPPVAAASGSAFLLAMLVPPLHGAGGILILGLVCGLVLLATAAATPAAREFVRKRLAPR